MKIEKLRIKTDSGETFAESLVLIENLGIEGDKKANGGDRQLTLADEAKLQAYRNAGQGLCIKRFMPNIATTGIDYENLKEGDKFKIGECIIEISGISKKCFPECELVKKGTICQIKKNCAFARILKNGTINEGDEIVEV